MRKFNKASGKASGKTACSSISPESASEQEFGYVRPHRLHKSGRRVPFFYRLPRGGPKLAMTKSLVFVLVLLAVVFVAGFVNKEHVPNQSGVRTLPTSVAPDNSLHRLITLSAVRGAVNSPVNAVIRMHVQSG